jgi:hypothetical protein
MRFLLFLLVLTVAQLIAAVSVQAQDIEDPGSKPIPEKDNWVFPTIGTPDITDMKNAQDGEVVCQRADHGQFQLVASGILMSEAKAGRCADYRVAYDAVKKLYQLDMDLSKTKLKIYEDQLGLAQGKVNELTKENKPGWWATNKGVVGFVLGLVIGVGLTIGVAAAVGHAAN